MQDVDGLIGQKKAPPDINALGEGYVRTVDHVGALGNTTLIDFAVSWSYRMRETSLAPGQTWRIALGSVHDQTDHAKPNVDIAGGATFESPLTSGWSEQFGGGTSVPEPSTFGLLALGVGLVAFRTARRRRSNPD